jgi:ERCC4-type nuclease
MSEKSRNEMGFEVTIDDRELIHNDWMLDYLKTEFPSVKFNVVRMEEGDFATPHVLVERKTIDDLWNSLYDGRFHDQGDRLMTHMDDKIIIYLIVGSVDAWEFKMNGLYKSRAIGRAPDRDVIDSMIASLIVRDNFRVICDSNERLGLKRMIRIMQKVEDEDVLDLPSQRNHAMLAARLFGMSKKEVLSLIGLYGTSITNWCCLTAEQLNKVKGFGPAKSNKFIKFCQQGW